MNFDDPAPPPTPAEIKDEVMCLVENRQQRLSVDDTRALLDELIEELCARAEKMDIAAGH